VLREHEMVRAETGADMRELFRFRIVHREMPARAGKWEELGRRMARPRLAEIGGLRPTNRRRDPDTTALVEHRVGNSVPARPERLPPPVRRRLRERRRGGPRARVA